MAAGGGAAGAGGGIGGVIPIGTLVSHGMNAMAASISWDRQKNLMTRGPTYVMEGLRKAGINPILAAGAGIKGGLSGSAIQAAAAQAGPSKNPALDFMQAKNLAAQTELAEAATAKAARESEGIAFDNIKRGQEAEFWNSDDGRAMIKARAYKDGLPDTLVGAGIRGGAAALNSAKDAFKGTLDKKRQYNIGPRPGRKFIQPKGNRDPQYGLP